MLQYLQLLPQRAGDPVLLQRESTYRLEIGWQVGGCQYRKHGAMMRQRRQVYKSRDARGRDSAVGSNRRDLDAFEPSVQFGQCEATLG
ncbi:hypothetical protein ASL20_15280 [Cupriavidus necator]|nr:hypothetical protein ASL20_15280 [Cupriavidus necator]